MKLSTLLLSSAAVLVAGAAFAADLPAKKAAPAAAATGCPAFGAGFFSIPGGDTCIKFSGYMAYEGSYANDGTYSQGGDMRIATDVRSNSEMGVVRGFTRVDALNGAMLNPSRLYAQLGGFTAGQQGSMADISGTNGWNYGSKLGGGTGVGLTYEMSAGSATVKVGLENAATLATGGDTAKRPDVLGSVKIPAGPATAQLVVASHEAVSSVAGGARTTGYAVIGKLSASTGGFGVSVFGGTSTGALKYTYGISQTDDYDGTDTSAGSNMGGEVTYGVGAGTLAVAIGQQTAKLGSSSNTRQTIGVDYAYTVAKGFVVEPEFIAATTDSVTSNTMYLTIHRDF